MSNPFVSPPSTPGHGTIHLALLPPNTPRLRTINYQYPLKLVSPAPLRTDTEESHLVHTVYLLTYGGGLVAGDAIDFHVTIEATTRLVLLTQGSTKLFKAPDRGLLSKQSMTATLAPGSVLCYLPDPVQPFAKSNFEQQQIYNIELPSSGEASSASMCVLDWISNGRPANGENWSFYHYASRNEVFLCQADGKRKLLIRDNMLLDDYDLEGSITKRMDGLAVYGTLILHGPLFKALGQFFMEEFKLSPRIGGKKWDSGSESGEEDTDPRSPWRVERHRTEGVDGVLWSAASARGCVVVKFGAPVLETGRRWLLSMLSEEKSVVFHCGDRALLCLR